MIIPCNLPKIMITTTDIKYAERLRSLRIDKRVKQELAFKLIGLKRQQEYSDLENGKKQFTDSLILKISKAFNISADEFMNPAQHTSIIHSPNANTTNSFNNDITLIQELLVAKNEIIASQTETIKQLKDMIEILKRK